MTTTVRITINKHSDVHVCARLLYLDGTEGHKHQCVPGNEEESCNFTIHDDLLLVVHEGVELQGAPNARIAELEQLYASACEHLKNAGAAGTELKSSYDQQELLLIAARSELVTAQARITELETSNADAQKRAAAQRGKTK